MIYLIRHAESIGNIGARTKEHSQIPLSERGKVQAEKLAEKFNFRPDLLVISPFLRTRQTAAPLLEKYPDVSVEYWEVQEFSYLDCEKCYNTTSDERKVLRDAYFNRNDFDYVDGKGAESFNQLIERVDAMLERLKSWQGKNVLVFTHGNFLRAVMLRVNKIPLSFEAFCALPVTENTGIICLEN